MRMSEFYLPTLKETPQEAEIISHQLMLRAGLIRKLSSGIYTYLSLGIRVLRKIEQIIREEMVEAGAQEILMPCLQPASLWQESGRWEIMGPLMARLKDRKSNDYCLGPTHEEVVTDLVRGEINSYKQLPLNLFQIQMKVRDEIRPRFGVLRSREFIMKDAYSFDQDQKGLEHSYQKMYEAYCRIFQRIGLKFLAVEADSGSIGGNSSHEFMVLAESGEDTIVYCENCQYAANLERARSQVFLREQNADFAELAKVSTPDVKTIQQLTDFFHLPAEKMIKTLIYIADSEMMAVLIRGSDELNEVKLQNHLQAKELRLATDEEISALGLVVGFLGPVGLKNLRLLVDPLVMEIKNAITGANELDYHYSHVNPGRDFAVERDAIIDLRTVQANELCVNCGHQLQLTRGIEVGHVFQLGTKYSQAMGARFLDKTGKERPLMMGCYGIGVTRIIGAAIEQNHDQDGIIWPMNIAPFQVIILAIGKDVSVQEMASTIYTELKNKGIEVLLDDRQGRPGVKFKDADLLGIPIRITIGSRGLQENLIEINLRPTGERVKLAIEEVVDFVVTQVNSQIA